MIDTGGTIVKAAEALSEAGGDQRGRGCDACGPPAPHEIPQSIFNQTSMASTFLPVPGGEARPDP
jgi:hypothetical protein